MIFWICKFEKFFKFENFLRMILVLVWKFWKSFGMILKRKIFEKIKILKEIWLKNGFSEKSFGSFKIFENDFKNFWERILFLI